MYGHPYVQGALFYLGGTLCDLEWSGESLDAKALAVVATSALGQLKEKFENWRVRTYFVADVVPEEILLPLTQSSSGGAPDADVASGNGTQEMPVPGRRLFAPKPVVRRGGLPSNHGPRPRPLSSMPHAIFFALPPAPCGLGRCEPPVNSRDVKRLAGTGQTTPEADENSSRDRASIMRCGIRQERGAAYRSLLEGRPEAKFPSSDEGGRYFDPKVRKHVQIFDSARLSPWDVLPTRSEGNVDISHPMKSRLGPRLGKPEPCKGGTKPYWIGDKDGCGDKCSLPTSQFGEGRCRKDGKRPSPMYAKSRLPESRRHNGVIVGGVRPDFLVDLLSTALEFATAAVTVAARGGEERGVRTAV
ncbi:hypothetical protein H4582DRAFT_2062422 [Lactarius indigo]|nr:hypothetical protein H4582DRAFT_2062422 [Lactarius indigo]